MNSSKHTNCIIPSSNAIVILFENSVQNITELGPQSLTSRYLSSLWENKLLIRASTVDKCLKVLNIYRLVNFLHIRKGKTVIGASFNDTKLSILYSLY